MRHLGLVVAAALVFALITPAFTQPFADVPTNHWAYDAIAELAAKGLIEGYPDGTFKGDRAMTRYEMAMVVARLLARVESIQIPEPQRPEVTKRDLDTIQRLVNEFRAELAALGVRVTAVEEELNAIKAKLDNVRITGAFRFRYNINQAATGASLNGNPRGFKAVDASNSPLVPDPILVMKLSIDGSVAPNVHLIVGMLLNGTRSQALDFNSSNFGSGGTQNWITGNIDNLFFDWRNAFGWPLEFWLGRFGGGGSPGAIGKNYPVQFGPFGLVMNTASQVWRDTTLNSNFNVVDGLAVFGSWPALADLQVQGLIARIIGGVGGTTYFSGEDAYGVDANVQVIKGVRIGGSYVSNNFTNPPGIPVATGAISPLYHVYGPAGAQNPATPNCPAAGTAGIRCPAQGSGWSGYVQWDVTPGIHFDGEYAGWNDAVLGGTDNGYQVNARFDLAKLMGIKQNFTVDMGYLNFGQNFYPPYGSEVADQYFPMNQNFWPGNEQAFLGQIRYDPIKNWTLFAVYLGGTHISNGQPFTEWQAGATWTFASRASITFLVRDMRSNNIDQSLLYRAQVDYSW